MSHTTSNNQALAKKKKHGRFNLVDFLLIVVVLLIVAMVIYMFAPFSKLRTWMTQEQKAIEYTIEIVGVEREFVEKIKENDVVVDSVSKNTIGSVSAVDYNTRYTELQYVSGTQENTGVLAEYPNRYNVIVTISASADYVEGEGYSVNHCRIAVGEELSLRFPDYSCRAFCIGLAVS
jgi:flagellar basal body-associated protein FliL